jgi:hypothetical protein
VLGSFIREGFSQDDKAVHMVDFARDASQGFGTIY